MADYWPQIITAAAGLGGAAVGAWASLYGQNKARNTSRAEDVRSLAVSIAAEAEAYLDLMQRRNHKDYARDVIAANKSGTRLLPKTWLSGFEKEHDPFPILRNSLPKIGMLGEVCTDIAKFYSQVTAIRTTLTLVDEGAYDTASAIDIAHIMESELFFWENTEKHGRVMIATLRRIR